MARPRAGLNSQGLLRGAVIVQPDRSDLTPSKDTTDKRKEMSDRYNDEMEFSDLSYKHAVLVMKFLEVAGGSHNEVNTFQKKAENCLTGGSPLRRAFGLNLLRFLYKKEMISIGWFLKRRIRGFLKSDPSKAVRLAAFDLLGAILNRTGSKSGVSESDYSTILEFRDKMLKRSSELRQYEISGVQADIKRFESSEAVQVIVDRIIADLE